MEPLISRTLGDLVREVALERGEAPALIHEGKTISWSDLATRMERLARGLRSLGVQSGDRVAVILGNSPEWILCELAVASLGGIFVGLNTWYQEPDLAYVISQSGARVLVCGEVLFGRPILEMVERVQSRCPALEQVVVVGESVIGEMITLEKLEAMGLDDDVVSKVSPEDPAAIIYTSGSTSRPKGVVLHHRGLIDNGLAIGSRQHVKEDDVLWLGVPLFFSFGVANALMVALTHGMTIVLQEHFEPGMALDLIEQYRCSVYYGMPHMTRSLLDEQERKPRNVSSLKVGLTLGPPEAIRMTESLVPGICNIYGLTETYGNCAVSDRDDDLEIRATSQGLLLPGFEMKVVDPQTGDAVPPGELGVLLVRGRVFSSYFNDDELTAEAFRADGWLDTGDIGSLDRDGRVRYSGRMKEMIKVGGINVSPAQVEDVILRYTGVRQVFVVGGPHSDRGEVPVAFVEWERDANDDTAQLIAYCRANLPAYAVPTKVIACREDELPRTATGKIRRIELVKRLKEEAAWK